MSTDSNKPLEENQVIFFSEVVEFVTVASEYCGFVEKCKKFERKSFLSKSQKILSLLYLKATLLPVVENEYDAVNERFVTEFDYEYTLNELATKLGTQNNFIEIEEPMVQESDDIVTASLAETYADIYQDLKNFVMLYQLGNPESMNDALWECKMNFEQYWGPRTLSLLKEIHKLLFGEEEISEEIDTTNPDNGNFNDVDTSEWIISQRFKDYQKKSDSKSEK